jgi:hypothetical protein
MHLSGHYLDYALEYRLQPVHMSNTETLGLGQTVIDPQPSIALYETKNPDRLFHRHQRRASDNALYPILGLSAEYHL